MYCGPLYGNEKISAIIDADIFVLPSIYETFPNVILEVNACRKPVIASNIGSISDIVKEGKTGLLFETNNSRDLALKIKYVIENPSKAKVLGTNAHDYTRRNFSLETVVNSIESLYYQLTNNNH